MSSLGDNNDQDGSDSQSREGTLRRQGRPGLAVLRDEGGVFGRVGGVGKGWPSNDKKFCKGSVN